MSCKLGNLNLNEYLSDDDCDYNNDNEFENVVVKSRSCTNPVVQNKCPVVENDCTKTDDVFSDCEQNVTGGNFIINRDICDQECFAKSQYKYNKIELQKKYDIIEEVSKTYKSMVNLLEWYRQILKNIECKLDHTDLCTSINELNQSTTSISNMIKVLFIKNYDVHSLFVVNYEDTCNKGYYVTQNYNKMLTCNKNLDIKFYYIDSVKFYDIKNSVFKMSFINECGEEYKTIKLGDIYNCAKSDHDLYILINNVYAHIEVSMSFIKSKYTNSITILNSLAILLQNY